MDSGDNPTGLSPIVQDIIKFTEVLLIVADGRPFLHANLCGILGKLSRRISHFLKRGAIHRDKFGEESCVPFLVSKHNLNNRHILRKDYSTPNDVIEWIAERVVESNLHQALTELSTDSKALEDNYDKDSCMRQSSYLKDLMECARFLDEQDIDGLNLYLLDHKVYQSSRPNSANSNVTSNEPSSSDHTIERFEEEDFQIATDFESSSLPDLTENGISNYFDVGVDPEGRNWLTDAAAAAASSVDMPDGKKPYVKGHKRSQSDTAVPSKIQIKSAKRKTMSRIPEISEHLSRTNETSSSSGSGSMSSLNRSVWKFPPPESEDQSLYDYIQSGKFTKEQSALDIDNAHIILAEAVIYAPQHQIKIKESQEQVHVVLPPSSPIREKSAEHTILSMLNLLEDPHFIKAVDTFKLLEERSGSGKDQTNGLRSTPDWFPPSKQLVFDYHPKPTKKAFELLKQQKWLCNNCGGLIHSKYAHTLRYCYYFGKYCCPSCHNNKTHVIPAHIVKKWDFKEKLVSNFALSLLTEFADEAIIPIVKLTPFLPKKVTRLKQAIDLRGQSKIVGSYIDQCRFAADIKADVKDLIEIQVPDVFSLNELCSIKLGFYFKKLGKPLELAINHIKACELCSGKGFICEGCRDKQLIFPFQYSEVYQCQKCYACFHTGCFKPPCSKCLRQQNRNSSLLE